MKKLSFFVAILLLLTQQSCAVADHKKAMTFAQQASDYSKLGEEKSTRSLLRRMLNAADLKPLSVVICNKRRVLR